MISVACCCFLFGLVFLLQRKRYNSKTNITNITERGFFFCTVRFFITVTNSPIVELRIFPFNHVHRKHISCRLPIVLNLFYKFLNFSSNGLLLNRRLLKLTTKFLFLNLKILNCTEIYN
jgi:hypothetical protein